MKLWLLAAAATGTASEAAAPGLGANALIGIAFALLLAGAGLLALEFLLVSGGMLGVGAAACLLGSIVVAFAAGQVAGWAFLVGVPIVCMLVVRWGLRWMQRSSMVVQAEISGDAGYHHRATAVGAVLGASGVLVTDAFPTGRARFADGEIDVTVRGAVLRAGDAVVVRAIEGPNVFVSPPGRPA
ncbi:MAG: NfeD family protein [Planctomycetes bacterium]|nr:NfeD family protein [Planctomycetota bacterium]